MKYGQIRNIFASGIGVDRVILTDIEKIESQITYTQLEQLLSEHDNDEELSPEELEKWQQLFRDRWARVQNTSLAYPYNTANGANKIFLALADLLQKELGISRFQLLMPTLLKERSDVTFTSLKDRELAVTDIVLSDSNQYFIEVKNCLDFAIEDGVLYHTQKKGDDNTPFKLSGSEQQRVIFHSKPTEAYMDAIEQRHAYKHDGGTIGSLLQLLIEGLRGGGSKRLGEEMDAAAQANLAIFNFARIYNEGLSEEQRKKLNQISDDQHNFFYYWDILALRQQREFDKLMAEKAKLELEMSVVLADIDAGDLKMVFDVVKHYQEKFKEIEHSVHRLHASVTTCVELTSNGIEALLRANKDVLYAMKVVDQELVKEVSVEFHDQQVKMASEELDAKLKAYANGQAYIAQAVQFKSYQDILNANIAKWLNQLSENQRQAICGDSELHDAVRHKRISDIERLCDDKNELLNQPNAFGVTPLHEAARLGLKSVVRMLVNKGAQLDAKITFPDNEYGDKTVLQIAARNGDDDLVRYCLIKGCYPSYDTLPSIKNLGQEMQLIMRLAIYCVTREQEPAANRFTPMFYSHSAFGGGYSKQEKLRVVNNMLSDMLAGRRVEVREHNDERIMMNGRLGRIYDDILKFQDMHQDIRPENASASIMSAL